MSITITGKTQAPAAVPVPAREPATRATVAQDKPNAAPTDKVTLGAQADDAVTYDKPRGKMPPSAAALNAILEESESKTREIMNLILPLIEQQGLNLSKVISGEQKLTADKATIDKAKATIADDGEFGVQQVADRILNFAKGAIGDDPSKLAAMRAAVEDGFEQAKEMLGGTLPEISERTRTVIMETFDRWASEGMAPEADQVS